MLQENEYYVFYPLLILVLLVPITNWLKKDPIFFWSPLTMVSLIFLYYTVIGPITSLYQGDTYFRLMDHRPFFYPAWEISLVAFVCVLIGFNLLRTKKQVKVKPTSGHYTLNNLNNEQKTGRNLFIMAIICLSVITGTGGLTNQIDIFDPAGNVFSSSSGGAFRNYFIHGMNFLIAASAFVLIAWLDKKGNIVFLVILVFLSLAIFTKQGFRWRHVLLGMSLLSCYHLFLKKKVNAFLLVGIAVIGVGVMGFIGSTRSYGSGLSLDNTEDVSNEEYLMKGLGESKVFMSTGVLVDYMNTTGITIGFDPLLQTVAMPIPRVIWPDKPTGSYLHVFYDMYSANHELAGIGVAVMNYGEYYMMYGYFSVVVLCVLLGLIIKVIWNWFLAHRDNKYAIVLYSVFFGFLYVLFSRGYMPQVFMLFMFTVFPVYYLYKRFSKIAFRRNQALKRKLKFSEKKSSRSLQKVSSVGS